MNSFFMLASTCPRLNCNLSPKGTGEEMKRRCKNETREIKVAMRQSSVEALASSITCMRACVCWGVPLLTSYSLHSSFCSRGRPQLTGTKTNNMGNFHLILLARLSLPLFAPLPFFLPLHLCTPPPPHFFSAHHRSFAGCCGKAHAI